MTAKSRSIKGVKRKFGGCAWKVEKLTSGDLSFRPGIGTGRIARGVACRLPTHFALGWPISARWASRRVGAMRRVDLAVARFGGSGDPRRAAVQRITDGQVEKLVKTRIAENEG